MTIIRELVAPLKKSARREQSAGWNLWVPEAKDNSSGLPLGHAVASDRQAGITLGLGTPADYLSVLALSDAPLKAVADGRVMWGNIPGKDSDSTITLPLAKQFRDSGRKVIVNTLVYPRDTLNELIQLSVDFYTVRPSEYDLRQSELLTDLSGLLDMTIAPYVPSGVFRWADYELTNRRAMPIGSNATSPVHAAPPKDKYSMLPWGNGVSLYYSAPLPFTTEPEIFTPGEFPPPDDREVHIIMNIVNVFEANSMTPIAIADVRITLDEDSYSWQLDAEVLNEASKDLLKADESGIKELLVYINGHTWRFFIPIYRAGRNISDRTVSRSYRITGYSRSQYLAAPYAPKRTRSIGSTTAVQAATDELSGTGFTLNWDTLTLSDWPIGGSVYSYQETAAISAIKRLASAVGAVISPGPDSDLISVRPRCAVAPWELAAADMDRTIHESQIFDESCEIETRRKINAVWVSGEQAGCSINGVLNGTAGDEPGDDVTDPFLTDVAANTARARQEIAASGDSEIYTLELAIPESSAQPGLLAPGLTVAVEYDNPAKSWRGYVTAVSVSAPGRASAIVRQTVTIRRPVAWEVTE